MLFYFASRVREADQPSAPFLAWPEGNGRIVAHLEKLCAERLKLRCLITEIVPGDDSVELAVLDTTTRKLERIEADHVIAALPKFLLRHLVRPWQKSPPDHLGAFSYGAWLVANLHLKRPPGSARPPVAWDSVIYEGAGLGYVSATHQALRDFGPTIWTYYQPLTQKPEDVRRILLDLDHPTAVTGILTDLKEAHDDLHEVLERVDVWRWGHAMIRPTPGFIWGTARRRAAEPEGRLHFAHSDLSGVALFEEAQDRGVLAAEAVARQLGRSFDSLVD
jgi:hypothetical protein